RLAGAGTDELVVVAFALIMTGLFVKAALLPFHFWHADSHAVAPTPICVLFGCVLIEVGIFAAARVHVGVFAEVLGADTGALQAVLLTVGLVTGAVTAVMCVLQSHLKRLLAFSSIAHVGIVTAGWGLLTSAGLAGAAVYVAGHGFVKAALFLLVGILLHHLDSVDEAQLHGRARGSPAAGGLFVAGGLALAGMPPFGMFTGKALIDSAGKDAGVAWLGTAVLAIAAVTGAAVVRAGLRIYAGVGAPAPRDPDRPDESEDYVDHAPARTPRTMIVTAAVLMIAGAATGAPQLVTAAEHAAGLFVDADVQAAPVLGGDQGGTPSVDRTSAWSADSVIEGMLAAAVALGLGIVTARRAGAPGAWGTESASPYSPVRWLRLMHSGRITDYVVWLCIGCAVLVSTSLLALR
ncbi:MAG TPA: proton-conducting transporter membrane subunit, partial [Egibacteraceae bacterium]|nr:proton-conducting transporter membrane subunit [Egibacteraceae bacterium]